MHDSLGLADLRGVLATVLGRGSLLDKYTKRHLPLSSKFADAGKKITNSLI